MNLLCAIKNIIHHGNYTLTGEGESSNRINHVGESLEIFIKESFANSFSLTEAESKKNKFSDCFSYIGNQNNPPDMMLKGGDAIEIKKIQSVNADIALNSSYPKDKLYADSPGITKGCKQAEDWTEKDLLYVIGVTEKQVLLSLWFIYGNCYAADRQVYERIKYAVTDGVTSLPGVTFSETKELGRVNRVDPLGRTLLRIRGMWAIQNPNRIFSVLLPNPNSGNSFSLNALMLKEKFESFPEKDKQFLNSIAKEDSNLMIKDVVLESPNNAAKRLDAILISYRDGV